MPTLSPAKQASYSRAFYERNRAACIARAVMNTAKKRAAMREVVMTHLRANPCVDCGEPDPVVLDFDHRDPETKLQGVGDMCHRAKETLVTLKAEMAKCDVRCANCHRRRTAKQFGWSSRLGLPAPQHP